MQAHVLGCSGGIGLNLRTTSILIDDYLLLDAGTGIGDLTLEKMLSIRHVLLTHAHLDHIAGLALMLASIYDEIVEPINLYAPKPVLDVLKDHLFNWKIWPDFSQLPDTSNPCLKLNVLAENTPTIIDEKYTVTPVLLGHTVASYAYIVQSNKSKICFCGDTGPTESLWQLFNKLNDIEHLIIEASYPNDSAVLAEQSGHYTPELLLNDLHKLHTYPKLHIHHIKPGCENIVKEQCNKLFTEFDLNILSRGELLTLTSEK